MGFDSERCPHICSVLQFTGSFNNPVKQIHSYYAKSSHVTHTSVKYNVKSKDE